MRIASLTALFPPLLVPLAAHAAPDCAALAGLALPGVTLGAVTHHAAGDDPDSDDWLDQIGLPGFCRVQGMLSPRPETEIHFEIWLPDDWNGRYLQAGNGGFAGAIAYAGLVQGIKDGFAVMSQDGGHQSEGEDMGWAVDAPGKIADFGWRALHDSATMSETMVGEYYGRKAGHSYFVGCSDGGREAMMSLQRFPEQFDGWLIGAPENDMSREVTTELVLTQSSDLSQGNWTADDLALVADAARTRCDATDGLADGIVSDPAACKPDLAALACKPGAEAGSCLAPDAMAAVKATLAGVPATADHPAFSGLSLTAGAEDDPEGWAVWLSDVDGSGPGWHELYAQDWFGTYVYGDPGMDLSGLDPARAYADSRAKAGRDVDAVDPDLSAQRAAGKKVIQYHGLADAGVPVQASLDYYDAVRGKLGGDVRDFYRLFLVPGMGHCGGGPGPNLLGGYGDTVSGFDPSANLLAALVDWVEKGRAPDSVIATKYVDDDPEAGVKMTRPVCAWPATARYDGTGPADQASSFSCR